ncbi:hypothetical protein NE235_32555 [Actinoallomurus spadix]|uniref:Uncharacterized protein n=1 Tax=Actinoallomurus spadix TaxID=79912 RepID=A0ABN0X0I5_9ACTN|nr:hypothetical protein [Actinoallomurus spadix]MCO5990854.1 hypothetical protein [Actinoallomurus spadix]
MTTELPDASAPAPYVVRFRRLPPVLMVVTGALLCGKAIRWIADALHGGHPDRVPPPLALAVASVLLTAAGAVRLARARRFNGVAFAVDAYGITLAASRDGARRFVWDEVSALVLFSRRTEFVQGTVRCVGLRLHPTAPGSPERHLAELDEAVSRHDLPLDAWDRLRRLDRRPSGEELVLAVSVHAEARGWRYHPARLARAMRAHAPGVPVAREPSERYYDLVGWRADQEELRRILEDAELRPWC